MDRQAQLSLEEEETMKRRLSLLVAVVVFLSTFAFSATKTQAAGIITYQGGKFVQGKGLAFVFGAPGFTGRHLRGASIYAGSNSYDLFCTVKAREEKIVCTARGGLTEFAGETAIIHLAGQVFYITMPSRAIPDGSEEEEEDEESVCPDPQVLGANVQFEDIDGLFSTEFIGGDTLDEVRAAADEALAGNPDLVSYKVVGDLTCGIEAE